MFSRSDLCSQIYTTWLSFLRERCCPVIPHNQLPAPRTDPQTSPKPVNVWLHCQKRVARANFSWQASSSHNFIFGLVAWGNNLTTCSGPTSSFPRHFKITVDFKDIHQTLPNSCTFQGKKHKGQRYKLMPQLQQSPYSEELLNCWVANGDTLSGQAISSTCCHLAQKLRCTHWETGPQELARGEF